MHNNVVGDGHNSINELIDIKNKQRSAIGFKEIKVDTDLVATVKSKGFEMNNIIYQGDSLQLRNVCNFGQGGEVKCIDLFLANAFVMSTCNEVAKKANLRLAGLNYIGEDITLARTPKFGFNEINAYPMPDVHYFADIEEDKPLNFAKKL